MNKLRILITREPFSDFFVFQLSNGYTEELEVEDARAWLKERGANMDVAEKCLDTVWNFQRAELVINNPKLPKEIKPSHSPNI